MGRHGDRTASGGSRRGGGGETGDGTAQGVAIPLIAAALVCLLATSGVWLFQGIGDTPKRDSTPIGLNVPTEPVAPPTEPASSAPASPGTASPTSSPNAPSRSPSPSARPSRPASPSPVRTTQAPAPRPPSTTAVPVPPPPPPPPTTNAPPPATRANNIEAVRAGWGTIRLTVSVDNPHTTSLDWRLTLTNLRDAEIIDTASDNDRIVEFTDNGAVGTSPLEAHRDVELTFWLVYYETLPASLDFTLDGKPYSVPVRRR